MSFKTDDMTSDKISLELLEKVEAVLKKSSEIIGDNNIYSNPAHADSLIRGYLRRSSTLEAKLKYVQDDLAKFPYKINSVEEAENRKADCLEKIKQNKEILINIEKENDKIKAQIEEINKNLPHGGDNSELFKSEKEIKDTEAEIQSKNQEISTLQRESKLLEEKYEEVAQTGDDLSSKINSVKKETAGITNLNTSEDLIEKREKRLNIQKALDAFIAEAEAQSNARRIVLSQRKETLTKQISEAKERQVKINEERNRVSILKEDIIRLEALIAREKAPKQENVEIVKKEKPPMNKDRISRLCLMLVTQGSSDELINSIGSELCWSKDQIDEFLKGTRKDKDPGIGQQWVSWLDSVTNDL